MYLSFTSPSIKSVWPPLKAMTNLTFYIEEHCEQLEWTASLRMIDIPNGHAGGLTALCHSHPPPRLCYDDTYDTTSWYGMPRYTLSLQDGRLKHSDIGKIWKDYPKELHKWMLRLTEIFDLTFPMSDSPENVVPCLLPQTEPEVSSSITQLWCILVWWLRCLCHIWVL